MAAYCFFDVRAIKDSRKMDEYVSRVLATVRQYDGRYVVRGGRCESVEGTWRPVYPVMIRFPSIERAYEWYNSPEYADLKALRLSATEGDTVFMESPPDDFVSGD